MMAGLAIPQRPEGITPAWLTAALRAGGAIADAAVTSYTCQAMEAFGWSARMARLRLTYDRPAAGAPEAFVVKTSAPDADTRHFFRRSYRREVDFYRQVAPHVALRVPRCHYADYDASTHDHILLLEDMDTSVPGDIIGGVGVGVATAYARAMAALHAQWWESEALDALAERYPAHGVTFARDYAVRLEPGLVMLRPYLDATDRSLAFRVQKGLQERWMRQAAPPRTLIHWDAHAANVLCPAAGEGELAVVDWQNCAVSRGIWDVTRFCVLSLPVAARRAAERAVVATYTATLVEHGVGDYSSAQAFEDYQDLMPLQFAQQLRLFASLEYWDRGRRAWIAAIMPRVVAALRDAADGGRCG